MSSPSPEPGVAESSGTNADLGMGDTEVDEAGAGTGTGAQGRLEAGPGGGGVEQTTVVIEDEQDTEDATMEDLRMRPEDDDGEPPSSSRVEADKEEEEEEEEAEDREREGTSSTRQSTQGLDGDRIASLPVYLSDSLPATSTLHVMQYPTYPRGRPLPVPDSARSRGMSERLRFKPGSNHVEVELPLDMRPAVYNLDRGIDMAKGANPDEDAEDEAAGSSSSRRPKVKREPGLSSLAHHHTPAVDKRLERTRLKSSLVPNQTNYLVGVVRDGALHLTPLHSILQLRPSMHYLDGLDDLADAEKRRVPSGGGGDGEEEEGGEAAAAAAPAKKVQNINVTIRGGPDGPGGGRGGAGPMDSRDLLMAAQREAEAEKWVNLDWRNEVSCSLK